MQILASDYDGTLHFEDGYHPKDLEAIKRFQKEENKFGLCSGRPLRNLWDLQTNDLHFDFVIASSGASVALSKEEVLFEDTLSKMVLEQLIEIADIQGMVVVGMEHFFADPNSWAAKNVAKKTVILSSVEQINEPILQVSIERESEEEAKSILEKIHAKNVNCSTFRNGTFVDVVAWPHSKATGIEALAQAFGCSKSDLYCIGDNYNDLPMIEGIEHSFSFPYAPEPVQQKAQRIVSSIAEAIEIIEK